MAEPLEISAFEGQLEFEESRKNRMRDGREGGKAESDVVKLRKERVLKEEWATCCKLYRGEIKWEAILYI